MKHWIVAIVLSAVLAPAASAYDYVAAFQKWSVFKDNVNGEPVCYAVTRAEDLAPKSATHGDVVFFVSYFRSASLPQSSLRVSFDLREDLKGRAIVSGKAYSLYAVGNEAFVANADERSIEQALKRGSELRVETTSERNTEVAYEFSLSGSSQAIDKARSLCG